MLLSALNPKKWSELFTNNQPSSLALEDQAQPRNMALKLVVCLAMLSAPVLAGFSFLPPGQDAPDLPGYPGEATVIALGHVPCTAVVSAACRARQSEYVELTDSASYAEPSRFHRLRCRPVRLTPCAVPASLRAGRHRTGLLLRHVMPSLPT